MQNTIILDLIEAKVTLYTVQADGLSLGTALWSGQVAERLTVREQWVVFETRPAGAAYPIKHPLVPQYEVSIERVWALPVRMVKGDVEAAMGARPAASRIASNSPVPTTASTSGMLFWISSR